MNYFLLTLVLFFSTPVVSAQVNWMTMDEALAAQKVQPKMILLKGYTKTCPNCKWMDKYAFAKADIATYINTHFYPVSFNIEGNESITYKGKTYKNISKRKGGQHQFAEALKIYEYPTLVFFDKKAHVINPVPGKLGPKKLELYVTMLASGDYKKVLTGQQWSDYQRDFIYKLQG